MFFIIENQRVILSYQIQQFCMDSFVHGDVFFFPLIDRLVCTIQNNQTLDALIKYVAEYHMLYSGQLEIRVSVYLV